MDNFLRLNLKYLIPDKNKNQSVFNKLKPGDTLFSKVIDFEDGKALLNIKGTELIAESKRFLQKGDIIKIRVQNVSGEKVFVEIPDESEIIALKKDLSAKESFNKLKDITIKESIKENIILKERNIKNVVKTYQNNFGKNSEKIDRSTIKTLLLMEKNGVGDSKKLFEDIRSYVKKDFGNSIELDKNFKENLKNAISNLSSNETSFDRGLNLVNNLRNLNEENIFEYMFFMGENNQPAEIKIEYEKEEDEKTVSKKNALISINLDLRKLGKLEVKVNLWKNVIDILFNLENGENKDLINITKNKLVEKLEAKGFKIGDIGVRTLIEDEREVSISEVNLKA